MIEAYWNEMFGEFKIGERNFQLPGFSEPLMSPQFGTRNIVGDFAGATAQTFKLCGFKPRKNTGSVIKVERLETLIGNNDFWRHQELVHQESYPFMKRLLPFLVKHQKPHFHFSIEEDGVIKASAIGGEGTSKCLLFNLVVGEDFRGEGHARKVLLGAQNFFSRKETFYWTVHPSFTLGADEVNDYHIVR